MSSLDAVPMAAADVRPGDFTFITGYRQVQRVSKASYGRVRFRYRGDEGDTSQGTLVDADAVIRVDTAHRA